MHTFSWNHSVCFESVWPVCLSWEMCLFWEKCPFASSCPCASEVLTLWEQVTREPLAPAKSYVCVFQPQVGSKRALCCVAFSLALHSHWLFVRFSQSPDWAPFTTALPPSLLKNHLCLVVCVVIATVDKQAVPWVHINPCLAFWGQPLFPWRSFGLFPHFQVRLWTVSALWSKTATISSPKYKHLSMAVC